MELKHDGLIRKMIGWSWRSAILLLPWQTRWFHEGPYLNGFPWEAGRMSFYASWIPLLLTIAFGFAVTSPPEWKKGRSFFYAGFALLMTASFFTLAPRATIQWWIEVLLLGFFMHALFVLRVPAVDFAKWFVYSLIPHALLGLEQSVAQSVFGSKWLGIASQDPATPGVSVVEYAGGRFLRAHGGFPHPNIFGGWLALAIPVTLWLVSQAKEKTAGMKWISLGGLFVLCLVLTFARGAWLGFFIGCAAMIFYLVRSSDIYRGRLIKRGGVSLFLLFVFFAFLNRDVVLPRLQADTRLEKLSMSERETSLKDGFALFSQHPLVGNGPRAIGPALASLRPNRVPPVPPHNVLLLILAEVGLVGFVGLVFLLVFVWKNIGSKPRFVFVPALALVAMSFFDHYPWSLWSGLCLTAFPLLLIILPQDIFLSVERKTPA